MLTSDTFRGSTSRCAPPRFSKACACRFGTSTRSCFASSPMARESAKSSKKWSSLWCPCSTSSSSEQVAKSSEKHKDQSLPLS